MKCPIDGCGDHGADGTLLSKHADNDYCLIKCPDCRGTGEIQGGDWWMCSDGSACRFNSQTGWFEFMDPWEGQRCQNRPAKPLYRLERAK